MLICGSYPLRIKEWRRERQAKALALPAPPAPVNRHGHFAPWLLSAVKATCPRQKRRRGNVASDLDRDRARETAQLWVDSPSTVAITKGKEASHEAPIPKELRR